MSTIRYYRSIVHGAPILTLLAILTTSPLAGQGLQKLNFGNARDTSTSGGLWGLRCGNAVRSRGYDSRTPRPGHQSDLSPVSLWMAT
jgi:hypothetical protein